ncbi:MAG: hypothetical protein M5U01_23765 [Ardenticatenaceae bacterium]|nr:hypothetical protein [Ardenticatenaceae bacterium]
MSCNTVRSRYHGARRWRSTLRLLILAGALLVLQGAALGAPARGGALSLPEDGPGWDDSNYATAFDPVNRRGRNPVYSALPPQISLGVRRQSLGQDQAAGSGNFRFTVPIVSLPGRGMDLNLALHYGSRLWHRAGNEIIYDIDFDWPAPGWSLGFGRMVRMDAVYEGVMLVDGDGTRHPFTGDLLFDLNGEKWFRGRTTDGSLIDYVFVTYNGNFVRAWAHYPDGMRIDYGAGCCTTVYPTRITDRNGNYISITYVNNAGPRIDTVTDTLGRVVRFHYETLGYARGLLTAITGPGLNGGTRTLLRVHYVRLAMSYAFVPGLTPVVRARHSAPDLIDALYFPATGSGYWFADPYSFSSYGMLAKVTEQRGMGFSATSLNEQGTVTAGTMTWQRSYDYPLNPDPSLTDAPAYTTMTERWEAMDTAAAVTGYAVQQAATPRRVEVTGPDGARTVQLAYNAPDQWHDGLAFQVERYSAGSVLLQRTTTMWEPGDGGAPRVARTEVADVLDQVLVTEYSYGPVRNQLVEVHEYDYSNGGVSLLRRTRTDYETAIGYDNRHIYNLPKVVQVFQGTATTPASRSEFTYDGQALTNAPGVFQHDATFNPFDAGAYDPVTDYRGNVTQVKSYADAANQSGAIVESLSYDITGNVVTVSGAACCEEIRYTYTAATQYAYPSIEEWGKSYAAGVRLISTATYDFNTGLPRSQTDPNGRTTQIGYDAASLRPTLVAFSTGATTDYTYNDAALTITETTRVASGAIARQTVSRFNGRGQVRRQETLAEGGGWDGVEMQYDALGRPWKQSQPFRAGQTPQWSETGYDALGRVTLLRAPDGSEVRRYYNEAARPDSATPAAGLKVRTVDAWGRERWLRYDGLGRPVEVVEPNPAGSGSVFEAGSNRTSYDYNVFGQLTLAVQGPTPAQPRSFSYDSLGRLTHQRLPEKERTLTSAGVYVGAGGLWSDVFTYDARSNLTAHTDARGVRTVYTYANDPLNRLQSVTYDTSGFGDTANPILPAPGVTYQYVTTGDVRRVSRVTVAGVATEDYAYDAEGRLSSRTVTLNSRLAYPLAVDYQYDSLDRLTEITYPAQYGLPGAPRRTVSLVLGQDGRLSELARAGVVYAAQIAYDAAGQVTTLTADGGAGQPVVESYTYDPATGLLAHQQVSRGQTVLLDLSYDYLAPAGAAIPTGRTGQLTRLTDHLDRTRGRTYSYDALGRLSKVWSDGAGAFSPYDWLQEYSYDAYGNRTAVRATGEPPPYVCPDPFNCTPPLGPDLPAEMHDGHRTLSYDSATNRITTLGFAYDAAGNQTRSVRPDGLWQRYQHDAAGRLARVLDDDSGGTVETYTYGAGRQRLATQHGGAISRKWTFYAWGGDAVIAEYSEPDYLTQTPTRWSRSNVYLGDRLLAVVRTGGSGELLQFHHPDRLGTRLVTTPVPCHDLDGDTLVSAGDIQTVAQAWHSTDPGRLLSFDLDGDGTIGVADLMQAAAQWGYTCPAGTGAAVMEQMTFPFGVASAGESTDATNPRFTSYDRSDTTKLDYAVNRFYDAQQGRFTQVDPLEMGSVDLRNPESLNLYAYVQNDPTNSADPTGLKWQEVTHCVFVPDSTSSTGYGLDCTFTKYIWVSDWVSDPDPGGRDGHEGWSGGLDGPGKGERVRDDGGSSGPTIMGIFGVFRKFPKTATVLKHTMDLAKALTGKPIQKPPPQPPAPIVRPAAPVAGQPASLPEEVTRILDKFTIPGSGSISIFLHPANLESDPLNMRDSTYY